MQFTTFEPMTIAQSGDDVVAVIREVAIALATGRPMGDDLYVHLWRFDSDGKVAVVPAHRRLAPPGGRRWHAPDIMQRGYGGCPPVGSWPVPEFQTSPGMRDILPPESARWRRFVEVFARGRRAGRLRAGHLAAARGPRRLPAHRRRHRRRHQGDVRLRRQGRPARRAAARADRVGVPGVRAAPAGHAVEGLVRRLAVPLREAAARPLPPVRPGRHRGARRRRPVPRRRGHRPRLGVLRGARPAPGDACCSTRLGEPDDRARYVDALRDALRGATSTRSAPRAGRRWRRTRCACSTASAARTPRSSPPRRASPTSTATTPARTSRRCRPACARSTSRSPSTPSWCAASTTTGGRRSSSRAARSTRRRTRSAAAAATTAWSSRSAVRPTHGIGFALGLDRTLLACDDEGVFAAAADAARRVRRRHHRRAAGARDHRRAARRRLRRRPGLREPQHEEPDEGRRPQRRRRRGHRRHRTSSPTARSCCARCAPAHPRRHGRRPDRHRPRPT